MFGFPFGAFVDFFVCVKTKISQERSKVEHQLRPPQVMELDGAFTSLVPLCQKQTQAAGDEESRHITRRPFTRAHPGKLKWLRVES
jgi:hypothetical protein